MVKKAFVPAILFLAFIIASIAFIHNYAQKENTLPTDHKSSPKSGVNLNYHL